MRLLADAARLLAGLGVLLAAGDLAVGSAWWYPAAEAGAAVGLYGLGAWIDRTTALRSMADAVKSEDAQAGGCE